MFPFVFEEQRMFAIRVIKNVPHIPPGPPPSLPPAAAAIKEQFIPWMLALGGLPEDILEPSPCEDAEPQNMQTSAQL